VSHDDFWPEGTLDVVFDLHFELNSQRSTLRVDAREMLRTSRAVVSSPAVAIAVTPMFIERLYRHPSLASSFEKCCSSFTPTLHGFVSRMKIGGDVEAREISTEWMHRLGELFGMTLAHLARAFKNGYLIGIWVAKIQLRTGQMHGVTGMTKGAAFEGG